MLEYLCRCSALRGCQLLSEQLCAQPCKSGKARSNIACAAWLLDFSAEGEQGDLQALQPTSKLYPCGHERPVERV